jgi:phosphatidate cytidylyltransferase
LLLTRVLTAVVVIAALLAALFLLEPRWFKYVVALIVLLGAYEWAVLSGAGPVASGPAALACVAVFFLVLQFPALGEAAVWLAGAFWVVAVPAWLSRGLLPGPRWVVLLTGLVVLVPAGLAMASLPRTLLLVLVGLSVVADTAAYFCGRAFGRRKLAPAISPGKTWEGALGGAFGCLIYATICAMLIPEIGHRIAGAGWVAFFFAVMLLCAASVLGDLFESALKRRAGAKDSGRLLPGHGGVLDRIDSATATLPLGLLLLLALGSA